ncbi:hypothetical protein ACF07V_26370 [Streptomyces sp. NPDC015661]|uniref:hypothetical protein n=1 Tax=Streptomyces sp. NPDC015661 TaxID=3364961 RepID=UPI0036FE5C6F
MSMKRSFVRAAATLAVAGLAGTAAATPAQAAAPAMTTTLAAATVSSSTAGGYITRSEIIERAKYWLGKNLTYNQGGSYPDSDGKYYRTDCSGYVSMAWHLTTSLNTVGIGDSADTYEISRSQLKAGDVLNSYYDHVILFDKWDDAAHTTFSYYSFGSTPVKHITGMSINASTIDGHPNGDYKALRYKKAIDGGTDGIGMWDPSNHYFHLRNAANAGGNDAGDFVFGATGMVPLSGDWDGIGTDGVGMYDPSNHMFYLRNSANAGGNSYEVNFGSIGDIPVMGDWDGNGTVTVGVWRPSNHTFYLKNSNTSGVADKSFVYGDDGMIPLAGDWDGVGADGIGMYDPATRMVYLRNATNAGGNDFEFQYGTVGHKPVVGDFDGDGKDTVAVWMPSTHVFSINNQNTNNVADYEFNFGGDGMIPVAGDWDGK